MCKPTFKNYILAGYPLLWLETYEEFRGMAVFANEVSSCKETYRMYSWDKCDGIKTVTYANGILTAKAPLAHKPQLTDLVKSEEEAVELQDPLIALDWADKRMPDNGILFLKDFHAYAKKDVVCRKIRNLIPVFKAKGKSLVIVSHTIDIPPEIEKEVTVVRFDLPDTTELRIVLKSVCESAKAPYPDGKDGRSTDEPILEAALGMTSFEAENAFAVSMVEKKNFDRDVVRREKAAIVRKTGLLEVVETTETLEDIGGLENLKEWLILRQDCFTEKAREFGVKPPRGTLLIGVPGCGKSLVSKAIATVWHRPLLRLDMGKVFGSYVGESEGNIRKCLQIAEAVQPCCLWIDELEKSFSGMSAGESDGHGTSKRVMGTVLTWLQEHTADVFVVATANNVNALPPELLRRFDSKFWVELPTAKQREDILSIHLRKVKREAKKFALKELAQSCEGFSGAEIEVWVKEAVTTAYAAGHELTSKDLFDTAGEITPISRMMADDIKKSREWAKNRGIKMASKSEVDDIVAEGVPTKAGSGRKIGKE